MTEDLENKKKVAVKSPNALREEKILSFWNEKRIFEKSLGAEATYGAVKGDFVFYDGPPFATGLPHFGHVLPTAIKDAIPRYKTMRGYRVRRRWGWDCHGLPIENLIEQELGLATKKDIIDYGIDRFNEAARSRVLRYAEDWRMIIPRLGRWVDMEDDYKTMDSSYTESVWWAFKNLHDKGLIYEGFKSMQICPRCETSLSNFEVNQGYKDITDISVYVKFELVDEPGTFMLAWTTTPWTLPGNVALAVNPTINYVKVEVGDSGGAGLIKVIVAEDRLETLKKLGERIWKVVETMKAEKLVGRAYKPVFDYYSKNRTTGRGSKNIPENYQNGWKIYSADFVTTTDGTGVVHIAPAFGADDMELGKKNKLPFIQHVKMDGTFKTEVSDFAGQHVKPKGDHQKADIEVIKYLAATHTAAGDAGPAQATPALFAKEKIIHPYPHCWRCDTPLINYATSSWFVKVPEIKNKLVSENKKIDWVPEDVGQGRFGNWLLGARDWAISRSRFWGAPLPVWRTQVAEHADSLDAGVGETVVLGSISDLKKYSHSRNTYYVMRHGEAENNTKNVISSTAETPHHLTETGRKQVEEGAKWLADKKIDLVFVSPFVRTRETAEIVVKNLGLKSEQLIVEKSIHELNAGVYDGIAFRDFISKFPFEKRFEMTPDKGENYADIKKRMGDFLYGLEKKYSGENAGKNILIITHDSPAFLLMAAAQGIDRETALATRGETDHFVKNGAPFLLDFSPLPHNAEYELDFHRPYIDDIELTTATGQRLVRVPEVFDCWFESGSMPFGEAHYPFENRDIFDPKPGLIKKLTKGTCGYPADFIAEGQDQTRGWFYSMLVLGVALFGKTPYKNVVVNGLVLAEDGQKMSKSKKNFPDLMPVVDKYGADALRYYLLSSPLVRAQEFCFSEKGVDEVVKKHIGRLNNVVTFYEMYAGALNQENTSHTGAVSSHPLDKWILARLAELTNEVTEGMEKYELDRASRPFAGFIDDLSTWYIRRSRDRFKGDADVAGNSAGANNTVQALTTTRTVLTEMSKLLAPFMPFFAEDIYQRMRVGDKMGDTGTMPKESVHLENWPEARPLDVEAKKSLIDMAEVRRISSLGLEARMKAKINVRQPLARLTAASAVGPTLSRELTDIICDEVNVKEVKWGAGLDLDTVLTPALKDEGNFREFVRAVQDLRKENNFVVSDAATLFVTTDAFGKSMIEKKKAELSKTTGLKEVIYTNVPADLSKEVMRDVVIAGMNFRLSIKK